MDTDQELNRLEGKEWLSQPWLMILARAISDSDPHLRINMYDDYVCFYGAVRAVVVADKRLEHIANQITSYQTPKASSSFLRDAATRVYNRMYGTDHPVQHMDGYATGELVTTDYYVTDEETNVLLLEYELGEHRVSEAPGLWLYLRSVPSRLGSGISRVSALIAILRERTLGLYHPRA